MRHDIAMSLQNVHDLQLVVCVTEENHIASEGMAANVRTQLCSAPAQRSR